MHYIHSMHQNLYFCKISQKKNKRPKPFHSIKISYMSVDIPFYYFYDKNLHHKFSYYYSIWCHYKAIFNQKIISYFKDIVKEELYDYMRLIISPPSTVSRVASFWVSVYYKDQDMIQVCSKIFALEDIELMIKEYLVEKKNIKEVLHG